MAPPGQDEEVARLLGVAKREVRSIERKFRVLKQVIARAEEAAADTIDSPQGGHTNGNEQDQLEEV